MANGILAFTLGLESSNFISNATGARTAITGITSAVAGLDLAIAKAFSRGADFERLHRRTGETVSDLFILTRAFEAVGIQSDSLSGMLFHLEKGLTGMSEIGENTTVDFAVMGLNMQKIHAMNAPQQFQAIAAALANMDRATASGIAGRLFGREGASNFLQLARSSQDFAAALTRNAAAADQMARNAAAFNQIEITLTRMKNRAQDFFAGIAEGAAPAVKAMTDALNSFDLEAWGQRIGTVISGISQSIKDQKLGELLSLSLNAGLESFTNNFHAMLNDLGEGIRKLLASFNAGTAFTIYKAAVLGALTLKFGSAETFDLMQSQLSQLGLGKIFGGTSDSAAKALAAFMATEAAKVPKGKAEPGMAGTPQTLLPAKPFGATSVEKMGFIFGAGGPSILADHARATAAATQQTAQHRAIIAQFVMRIGNRDYFTTNGNDVFSQSTSAR